MFSSRKRLKTHATTLTEMSSGGYNNNSLWGSFWRTVLCLIKNCSKSRGSTKMGLLWNKNVFCLSILVYLQQDTKYVMLFFITNTKTVFISLKILLKVTGLFSNYLNLDPSWLEWLFCRQIDFLNNKVFKVFHFWRNLLVNDIHKIKHKNWLNRIFKVKVTQF